ncbi:MAG: transglycosylase family protein [Microthrixaceae bacterium]
MRSTRTRTRLGVVLALTLTVALGACTPEQQAAFTAQVHARHARLAAANTGSLSDAQLRRLAACESGGNPRAVSASGAYRGLYQFDQRTWNGVARSVLPEYVGVSPSAAPAAVQDAMARALYTSRGRSPWPVCGRRL